MKMYAWILAFVAVILTVVAVVFVMKYNKQVKKNGGAPAPPSKLLTPSQAAAAESGTRATLNGYSYYFCKADGTPTPYNYYWDSVQNAWVSSKRCMKR